VPGGRAEPVILARKASRACDSNGGPSPGVAVVEPELALLSQFGLLCQRLMTAIEISSRRKRTPSGEVRSMTQSSLWRLGVGEVDAADMVYAADWGALWHGRHSGHGVDAVEAVALGEVGAAESCSTRRTEARCGAVDAADTGSTLWTKLCCGERRGRATGE
jgi:hypothetical protein